ncbi:MAG TPA: hypothetical protein PKK26_15660 [Candidatus Wallbacteria bacterium]|nr:hypothetical protein [Candidatus Wallbacteria bacterium]
MSFMKDNFIFLFKAFIGGAVTVGLMTGTFPKHAAAEVKRRPGMIEDQAASGEKRFGKKLFEIPIGTDETQLGLLRSGGNKIPFGMYYGPSSCAVDENEKLYVIDCRNHRVTVFNLKEGGSFLKSINYFTDRDHASTMADIAVAADGSFFLADSKNKNIVKFSSLGMPEAVFGAPEPGKFAGLKQLGEIAVDKKGNVYARDFSEGAVYKFGPDGKFAGELKKSAGLYFTAQNAHPFYEFHEDSKSWKIFMESEAGETQKMIYELKRESQTQNIQFIGIDREDNIFLKSFTPGKITVLKISREGKRLAEFSGHNEPGFDTTRYFFVNPAKGSVYAIRYNGKAVEIDEMENAK